MAFKGKDIILIGGVAVVAGLGYLVWQSAQAAGRVPIVLVAGWNEVGIPDGWNTSASALCAEFSQLNQLSANYVEGSGYTENFVCGWPLADFSITTGKVVWIYANESVTLV